MSVNPTRASLAELVAGDNAQQQVQVAVGQERFCREIAAGHLPEVAYRRAYSLHDKAECFAEAYRMARLPHIVARTMQLRTASIKGYVVEREMLLENLLWAVNTARERGSTTEVRKNIEAIGKLFGLIVDKIDANIMGQFTLMKEVSIDGSNLVFDIGSGAPVVIKGDRVDDDLAKNASPALMTEQNGVKTVANQDDTTPLAALQNASKTLPAQSVELAEVPIEAILDDIGAAEGNGVSPVDRTLHAAKLKRHHAAYGLQIADGAGDEASAEELALLGEIA